MKLKFKIKFSVAFLIIGIAIYFFTEPIITNYHLEKGRNYLNQKNYIAAYEQLKKVVENHSDNISHLYFYAYTLKELPKTPEIQEELIKIRKIAPLSSAGIIAFEELQKLIDDKIYDYEPNYIENISFNNKILRWNLEKPVLKIMLGAKDNSVQVHNYQIESVVKAFHTWQSILSPFVKFETTKDIKEAQIIVLFTNFISSNKCNQEDKNKCHTSSGLTEPEIQGNVLKRMKITLTTKNSLDLFNSKTEIYNTALHEIGHSLGIMGHSYNQSDLMYPVDYSVRAGKRTNTYIVKKRQIKIADINTLKLLYKMNPDITNSPIKDKSQLYAPQLVLGSEQEIVNQKIKEAKNYVQTVPGNAIGWMALAEAYYSAKDFSHASEAFTKALNNSKSDTQKADIYYNMAIMNYQSKLYDRAVSFAKNCLKYNPEEQSAKELLAFAYMNSNNTKNAQKAFDVLINDQPDNPDHYYNLAMMYLKHYNFVMVGKTINKLYKVKPSVRYNDKFKKFQLFTFLFK